MASSGPAVAALFEVRPSRVHGLGAFALTAIPKSARLIEYVGERVSHREADRRYAGKDANDAHTFLFIVDSRTVIDAGVGGNEARFFNHCCDPNCESVIERGRVYLETLRAVSPGEELTYDYQIQREADDPPNVDEVFACHCGAAHCRRTMLSPAAPQARHDRRRAAAAAGSEARARGVERRGGSKKKNRKAEPRTAGKRSKRQGPSRRR